MSRLDVEDGFDVHDYRDILKLRRQGADRMELENREGLGCPACGGVFDRLFVTDRSQVTFGSAPDSPICLVRTPDQLLLLTHPEGAGAA